MRLNIGSGQRKFGPGWTNVDSQARWTPDVCIDGWAYLTQQKDASVEMICLHHVLEHYGCGEADALLAECHRVLAPGGGLLVFVPDMLALAQGWIKGRVTDQVYLTNVYGAYMGDEADRHKFGFTTESLAETLGKAGFSVERFNWRKIPGADIAGPDWWILGMEATK